MTIPAVIQTCWPVDTEGCEDFETLDPIVQDLATALAGTTMRMLTGYSLGECPVTVRPCTVGCARSAATWTWTGATFVPQNWAGLWSNVVCGRCGIICDCGLGQKQVQLPGVVGEVIEVKVDGVVLPTTAYEVHGYSFLVRTDGGTWPSTQAMDEPDTEVGTWSVRYTPGIVVDGLGARVAGVLACEYAKALTNRKCELPQGVTQVARQGITITKTPGVFPGGLTGIRVVDAYIMAVNPHHLKEPPAIWSPEDPQFRTVR